MLTHRTNLLLSEDDNRLLTQLAHQQGVTKGKLIRAAIAKVYRHAKLKQAQAERIKLMQNIQQNWSLIQKSSQRLDYQELRDYGRSA